MRSRDFFYHVSSNVDFCVKWYTLTVMDIKIFGGRAGSCFYVELEPFLLGNIALIYATSDESLFRSLNWYRVLIMQFWELMRYILFERGTKWSRSLVSFLCSYQLIHGKLSEADRQEKIIYGRIIDKWEVLIWLLHRRSILVQLPWPNSKNVYTPEITYLCNFRFELAIPNINEISDNQYVRYTEFLLFYTQSLISDDYT